MPDVEMAQVIATYNAYLERMTTALHNFCEDLQESDYQEITVVLPSLVEGFEWMNQALDGFVKVGKVEAGLVKRYQDLLKNILETLENKDYLLLHDLFEYEMLPLVGELKIQ